MSPEENAALRKRMNELLENDQFILIVHSKLPQGGCECTGMIYGSVPIIGEMRDYFVKEVLPTIKDL